MKNNEVMIIKCYKGEISRIVVIRHMSGERWCNYEVKVTMRDPKLRCAGGSEYFNNEKAAMVRAHYLAGNL